MATDRQIEANRLNALKSTGPRTVEGKLRSRGNSLVHGMAGTSGIVEHGMTTVFESRRDEWSERYGHLEPSQEFALDRLVAASIRIEQCENAIDSVIALHSRRAELAWDIDQKVVAVTLASKLAKHPMLVRRQLESTRHGCEYMVELWGYLEMAGVEWSDDQRTQALDLLGIPLEARNGPTPLDSKDLSHQTAMAQAEIKRLQTLIADLTPIDALDRELAVAGDVALLSKNAQLLMRYEREAWRRFYQSAKELRTETPVEEPAPIEAVVSKPSPILVKTEPQTGPLRELMKSPLENYSYVNISASPTVANQRT